MKKVYASWKMMLGFVIAAALMACGSVKPNGPASPPDANNPADSGTTVDTDRPAPPNQDVIMTSDNPTPPHDVPMVDVPATPPDASVTDTTSPTPDAGSPSDASMVAEFDRSTCAHLNAACWGIDGTSECNSIICEMQGDGSALLRLPENIGSEIGFSRATCVGEVCTLTTMSGNPTNWRSVNMRGVMHSFTFSNPPNAPVSVVQFTGR